MPEMNLIRSCGRVKVVIGNLLLGGRPQALRQCGVELGLGAGSVSEQVARFTRNMILTRLSLRARRLWRHVAIVSVLFKAIIGTLTDVGQRASVIQNPRGGEDAYLNAGWWIAMCRALSIYAIIFALGPRVAQFLWERGTMSVASSRATEHSVRWRHESAFHPHAERDEAWALDGYQQRRWDLWGHCDGDSQFLSS